MNEEHVDGGRHVDAVGVKDGKFGDIEDFE